VSNGFFTRAYGRFKKRKLFVFLGSFCVIVLLSIFLLAVTGAFGTRNELVRIPATPINGEAMDFDGVGLNLDRIPMSNFIMDPSFENSNEVCSLTVASADEAHIYFDSDELNQFNIDSNANIRVFSMDETGAMILKYQGAVLGYDETQIGNEVTIEDPNGLWITDTIVDIDYLNNTLVALTQSGKLISDISDEQLMHVFEAEDIEFKDICSNATEIYAITSTGTLYSSVDGRNFSLVTEDAEIGAMLINESVEIQNIASVGNAVVAALSNGEVLVYSDGEVIALDLGIESGIAAIESSGNRIMIVSSDAEAYVSLNGLVFRQESVLESVIESEVVDVDVFGDDFYCLLNNGTIVKCEYNDSGDATCSTLSGVSNYSSNVASLIVADENNIVVLDSNGATYLVDSNIDTVSIASSDGVSYDEIYSAPNGKVIVLRNNTIGITSILSDIRIDGNSLSSILPGDICFIEATRNCIAANSFEGSQDEISENDDEEDMLDDTLASSWQVGTGSETWDYYGPDTYLSVVQDSANGYGSNCARVTGLSDNIHMLSQELNGSASDIFEENAFYRIDIYLKQSGINNGDVNIWISGEGFEEQGFSVSANGKFTMYSYVFAINDTSAFEEGPVRLNISFEGQGVLFVDGIYLGLDKNSEESISSYFRDAIVEATPSVIRLNNLSIGETGLSESSIFLNGTSSNSLSVDGNGVPMQVGNCASLEESLRLVRDSQSTPWLVFGSCTDPTIVNGILEYMCGSVSSTYGKLRIDNGTAFPWSRQFETIYIEINDSEGNFVSDIQKSAYVDYITGIIRSSEYYTELKDRIVFLDGMNYEGGMMLSSADYHCSEVDLNISIDTTSTSGTTFTDLVNEAMDDAGYNSPRVTSHGTAVTGEFISSLSMSYELYDGSATIVSRYAQPISSGQYMSVLLSDSSAFSRRVMYDVRTSYLAIDNESNMIFVPSEYNDTIRDNLEAGVDDFFNFVSTINQFRYSSRLSLEALNPIDETSSQTAEMLMHNCSCAMYEVESTRYIIVSNSSSSQQQFVIENAGAEGESRVNRYSSSGIIIQSYRLTSRTQRITLQAGEYVVVTIQIQK
jgi:hypothetical protein